MAASIPLKIKNIHDKAPIYYNNKVLCNGADFALLSLDLPEESTTSKVKRVLTRVPKQIFIIVRERFVFTAVKDSSITGGTLGLNLSQMKCLEKSVNDTIKVKAYIPPEKIKFDSVGLVVMLLNPADVVTQRITRDDMTRSLKRNLHGKILVEDQSFCFKFDEVSYEAVVVELKRRNPDHLNGKVSHLVHGRGILLYGPPGSGKTYLATKICELLKTAKPKIVNGPELMSMWYGQTNKNISELFRDAIEDFQKNGLDSSLHVIVFDELDSLAPKRTMSMASDSAQSADDRASSTLLTMLDGLGAVNNVFVIGTTNRKDKIDEALLRRGRIGLSYEVGYPDEGSRFEMLNVILKPWRRDSQLADDVNIRELAKLSDGCVPSSLRSLLGETMSIAMLRTNYEHEDIKYTRDDFLSAINNLPKKLENTGKASTSKSGVEKIPDLEKRVRRLEEAVAIP